SAQGGSYVLEVDPYNERSIEVRVDFCHEHEVTRRRAFRVLRVLHIEPAGAGRPDVALLRVARRSENDETLAAPICLAETDAREGAVVGVVGYPARDAVRNDAAVMTAIFGEIYDVKRFHPG